MRIITFDGTDVWFEVLEPKWSQEEINVRDQRRKEAALNEAGFKTEWVEDRPTYDPWTQRFVPQPGLTGASLEHYGELSMRVQFALGEAMCHDQRENIGLRRGDGKPLVQRIRKAALDKMADELGVPTREAGWEANTLEALRAAPARGRITVTA